MNAIQIQDYLPELVSYQTFEAEIILQGPQLNQAHFDEIILTLPAEIRTQVIGWQRTGR